MILLKSLLLAESKSSKSVNDIKRLLPQLVAAAQKEYDEWDQSDPDNDFLSGGGICQEIAGAIADVLSSSGIDATTVDSNGMGEQHVWAVANTEDGVYAIDVPYNQYERGGGYTWHKIPGVIFDESSIDIYKLPASVSWDDIISGY